LKVYWGGNPAQANPSGPIFLLTSLIALTDQPKIHPGTSIRYPPKTSCFNIPKALFKIMLCKDAVEKLISY
jgi:hypothetical protein